MVSALRAVNLAVRFLLALAVFALAALALLASGHAAVAIIFAAAAGINAALLTWLDQWER